MLAINFLHIYPPVKIQIVAFFCLQVICHLCLCTRAWSHIYMTFKISANSIKQQEDSIQCSSAVVEAAWRSGVTPKWKLFYLSKVAGVSTVLPTAALVTSTETPAVWQCGNHP